MRILDHHMSEEDLEDGKIRRSISNFANWQDRFGTWRQCAPDVVEAPDAPDAWSGAYEFTHASRNAVAQLHFGDSTDPANTALVGIRSARRPYNWLNYKALNVNAVPMEVNRAEHMVAWRNLWPNTDLELHCGRRNVKEDIVLKAPGHPVQFRFALRIPASHSLVVENNSARITDLYGETWLAFPQVVGFDADRQLIRCTFIQGADITVNGKTFPTVIVRPNATDLASAVYPVRIDPTATISGSTAIDDDQMTYKAASNYMDRNCGGYSSNSVGRDGPGYLYRSLIRVRPTSFPEGSYTAFRMILKRQAQSGSVAAGQLIIHRITDANTWVEGTSIYAIESGKVCWNYCAYNTQAWAGSAGCSTSGIDYDASGCTFDFPAYTSGPLVTCSIALTTQWAVDLKSGARVANGFRIAEATDATDKVFAFATTESTDGPSFEIDYYPYIDTDLGGGNFRRTIYAGGIEDTALGTYRTTYNYGAATTLDSGNSSDYLARMLFRIATSSLPAGNITAFRFKFYRAASPFSVYNGSFSTYEVNPNNTWVEGTSTGGEQAGAACWNYAKFNTQAWAGDGTAKGCGVSGTDYYADASPPTYTYTGPYTSGGIAGPFSLDLKSSWVVDWRDGAVANNGFVVIGSEGVYNSDFSMPSTEAASGKPYFEIDYELGIGAKYINNNFLGSMMLSC